MSRHDICQQLTKQVKQLKEKENVVRDGLPDVELIYGTQPYPRCPLSPA